MATKTLNARLKVYTGTASQWTASTAILYQGELALETDTNRFKFGDGANRYAMLPYAGVTAIGELIQDASHRFVTDAEKAAWNAKQSALTFDTAPASGSANPVTSGGVHTALSGKADASNIPTKVSQLANDSGFQTAPQVSGAITAALGSITSLTLSVVDTLPVAGQTGTIYFLSNSGSGNNVYDEYVWVNGKFEKMGSRELDLSGYATKEALAAKVDKADGKGLSTNDYTTAEKNKLSGIAAGANNYIHPTAPGSKHIPSGGASGQILRWSADGTAGWGADQDTTYSAATTTAAGLMSAADKVKLNGIETGANKTTVDATLSSTSANPVQNKAVQAALAGKLSADDATVLRTTDTLILNGGELT